MHTTLSVSAIRHGTVIDHIRSGNALAIIALLDLKNHDKKITIGINLESKHMGAKDIIKIENRELTKEQANRVALVAPEATINIIQNYTVRKKFTVALPDALVGVIICPNPSCITNHERMETRFRTKKQKKEILLQCFYCEKMFTKEEIH